MSAFEVSPRKLRTLEKIFRRLDEDHDGRLAYEDIAKLFDDLGEASSSFPLVQWLIRHLDLTATNTWDFEAFVIGVSCVCMLTEEEVYQLVFLMIDEFSGKTGLVSVGDLRRFYGQANTQGFALVPPDLLEVLEPLDEADLLDYLGFLEIAYHHVFFGLMGKFCQLTLQGKVWGVKFWRTRIQRRGEWTTQRIKGSGQSFKVKSPAGLLDVIHPSHFSFMDKLIYLKSGGRGSPENSELLDLSVNPLLNLFRSPRFAYTLEDPLNAEFQGLDRLKG